MTYYCTHCLKYHADNYKKHWRYKKMVEVEEDPQILGRLEQVEKYLSTIIGILIHWKIFIDRKHPYSHTYQPLFDDL